MSEVKPIEELFEQLIEMPSQDERREFVDRVCGDDIEMKNRLEKLAIAHEDAGSFLCDSDGLSETTAPEGDDPVTTQIGRYKLLQKIGEGGMGSVYMAEQKVPVKRRVALKIIKPGMDSRQVIARFEAERQALAMMDHPNIAKVLEAGTTDDGHPYFVMELVKGVPITDFCDKHKLRPAERLKLFIDVCGAVQHAHQKGIIHRDLKPSNVLVAKFDDKPAVKVIDFGVAKATNQELTERTMFTQFGQIVGTLEYMSPEQAQFNQLDIDTRSDIYSLGVLLYELLTGETPFDRKRLRSAAFDEMLRIIREEEPPKPSAKLRSSETLANIAENRRLEPRRLGGLIKGDLDWIVMKALEKERSRRYDSATRFAEDIQNHLDRVVVSARPPSTVNRIRKFYQRNRIFVISSAAMIMGLSIALTAVGLMLKQRINNAASLGEAAMERGLVNALNGNRQKTAIDLQIAKDAGINPHRIAVIEDCLELYADDGKYDVALAKLRQLRTRYDSYTANALTANAALWSGRDFELHYEMLEGLQLRKTAVLDGEMIDLEERIFLGQACLFECGDAIKILEPAYLETKSPVARLLLGQAQMEQAYLDHDRALAKEAFENVHAGWLYLPNSSMARSLRIYSLHLAWNFDLYDLKDHWLEQALELDSRATDDLFGPAKIFAYQFFADAEVPEAAERDWEMVETLPIDVDVVGRILRRSPRKIDSLVEALESRRGEPYTGWNGIPNSLFLLHALNLERHELNRTRIEELDVSAPVLFGIDTRQFALMASLIMDGRNPKATELVEAIDGNKLRVSMQPTRLAEFSSGEMNATDFLSSNSTNSLQKATAELIVATYRLGERNRESAIVHLKRCLDTTIHFQIVALPMRSAICSKQTIRLSSGFSHNERYHHHPLPHRIWRSVGGGSVIAAGLRRASQAGGGSDVEGEPRANA